MHHWLDLRASNVYLTEFMLNLSLRLVTKARACKGVGQKGNPRVTSLTPGSAKECEGINRHSLK
jgi:hypothetical protein